MYAHLKFRGWLVAYNQSSGGNYETGGHWRTTNQVIAKAATTNQSLGAWTVELCDRLKPKACMPWGFGKNLANKYLAIARIN